MVKKYKQFMPNMFECLLAQLNEHTRKDWEERAAIYEYLGGMTRESAENQVVKDIQKMGGKQMKLL
jgi:hypothetical protein